MRRLLAIGALGLLLGTVSPAQEPDRLSTFFVGRISFATNDGTDCGDVGAGLVRLVARTSTIKVQEERHLRLADDGLFETPFLFMNGHYDFVLSEPEKENLGRYLSWGGFVMASGCCTNPAFPAAWRREFGKIFPGEVVKKIPYDHLIYRSFYRLEKIHSANGDRDIEIEGLFYQGDLVAVMAEDGLCCSFNMGNECNRGRGISPDDAKKLALNIAVYSLTH